MSRLYNILNKLVTPETVTPTITATTGELVSATMWKVGKVAMLTIAVKNASAVTAGSNLFAGTMANYLPKILINGSGYVGACAAIMQLDSAGNLYVRATGASINANVTVYVSTVFILA